MKVVLKDISKRYTSNWILKKMNYVFESGTVYGVQGLNGSGKSTLMQIISSQLSPTLGEVSYYDNSGSEIPSEKVPFRITFSAPYILPIEDLSIRELFDFFITFRKIRNELTYSQFLEHLEYPFKESQLIKSYSSGMKQRILLAFTILTESDLILLDEPTSYLDEDGRAWYHKLLNEWRGNNTVIISTNDKEDLKECTQHIHL